MSSQDIELINKCTTTIKVNVKDSKGIEVSLTYLDDAYFTVKALKTDPDIDAVLQVTAGDGTIVVVNEEAGELEIRLTSDNFDIEEGTYWYDLTLSLNSLEYVVLYGQLTIQRRVTD